MNMNTFQLVEKKTLITILTTVVIALIFIAGLISGLILAYSIDRESPMEFSISESSNGKPILEPEPQVELVDPGFKSELVLPIKPEPDIDPIDSGAKPVFILPVQPESEVQSLSIQKDYFSVQVGAFLKFKNAEKFKVQLKGKGYNPYIFTSKISSKNRTWYLVRIFDFSTIKEAHASVLQYKAKEKEDAYITNIDNMNQVSPRRTEK